MSYLNICLLMNLSQPMMLIALKALYTALILSNVSLMFIEISITLEIGFNHFEVICE